MMPRSVLPNAPGRTGRRLIVLSVLLGLSGLAALSLQAQTRPVEERAAPPVSVQYVTRVV